MGQKQTHIYQAGREIAVETDLGFKVDEEVCVEADPVGCDVHVALHQDVPLPGTGVACGGGGGGGRERGTRSEEEEEEAEVEHAWRVEE